MWDVVNNIGHTSDGWDTIVYGIILLRTLGGIELNLNTISKEDDKEWS